MRTSFQFFFVNLRSRMSTQRSEPTRSVQLSQRIEKLESIEKVGFFKISNPRIYLHVVSKRFNLVFIYRILES